MKRAFVFITVTLCATVFYACGANPTKSDTVELPSGEETAKAAADAARKAEADKNTGIRSESSNQEAVSQSPPTTQPTSQPVSKSEPFALTIREGKYFVGKAMLTEDALLQRIDAQHKSDPKLIVSITVESADPVCTQKSSTELQKTPPHCKAGPAGALKKALESRSIAFEVHPAKK